MIATIIRRVLRNSLLLLALLFVEREAVDPSLHPQRSAGAPLGAPIAFPIFRPPMVSAIKRQKSSAENGRLGRVGPSNGTIRSEEISSVPSSASSDGAEEEINEMAFHQRAPIFEPKTNNGSQLATKAGTALHNNHPLVSTLHRLTPFGSGDSKGLLDNGSDQHHQYQTANISTSQHSLPDTNNRSSSMINTSSSIHLSPAVSSITPQFPVFTGMGMEIIESNESGGDGTSSAAMPRTADKEEIENHQNWDKMHYNRAEQNKSTKLTGNATNRNGMAIPMTTRSWSSTMTVESSTTTKQPPEWSKNFTTPTRKLWSGANNATMEVSGDNEEVTDDLLALFATSPSPAAEHPHSTIGTEKSLEKDGGEGFKQETGMGLTEEEKGEDGLTVDIGGRSKQSTMGPKEEVIPRPANPMTSAPTNNNSSRINHQGHLQQQQQQESRTAKGEAATLPISPSSSTSGTSTATATVTRVFTRFPLLWTTPSAQSPPTTTSMISSTSTNNRWDRIGATPSPTTEWKERRITVGTPKQQQHNNNNNVMATTSGATRSSTDWSSNGIEEEMEQFGKEFANGRTTATTITSWGGTSAGQRVTTTTAEGPNKNNKSSLEGNNQQSARSANNKDMTESGASFRLFVMASIIAILFVAVGIGSICTGRYVRKSRQLHGKYRPAAYEMQTTRPPPLTSSPYSPGIGANLMVGGDQQQQQHFQQVEFVHHPGKDERLI